MAIFNRHGIGHNQMLDKGGFSGTSPEPGPTLYTADRIPSNNTTNNLRKILDEHPREIQTSGFGHKYYLDHANSRIIFIPYGSEWNKPRSIKLELLKNGKWETAGNKLETMARVFCATYDTIVKGTDSYNKKNGYTEEDGTKLNFSCYMIDVKRQMVRLINNPWKTDPTSILTGHKIKVDQDVWQDIEKVLGKNRKENDEHSSSDHSSSKSKPDRPHHDSNPDNEQPLLRKNRDKPNPEVRHNSRVEELNSDVEILSQVNSDGEN